MTHSTGNEENISCNFDGMCNSCNCDKIQELHEMVSQLHELVIGALGSIQDAQVNGTGMQRMVANQLPDMSNLMIPKQGE